MFKLTSLLCLFLGVQAINGPPSAITDPEVLGLMKSMSFRSGQPKIDICHEEHNFQNVRRVANILSEEMWDYFFPMRNPIYTYRGFLDAVAKFPTFCGSEVKSGDAEKACRNTLATLFAHFTQEVGAHNPHDPIPEWRQGLYWLQEVGCETGACVHYCLRGGWAEEAYPCYGNYHGRGPFQLSWNYNYGPFSKVMYDGDKQFLLKNPDLVHTTPSLVFSSAIWFAVTPQSPKPSIVSVANGDWVPNDRDIAAGILQGFGATINVINGGLECNMPNNAKAANRIKYYENFAAQLDYIPTGLMNCATMQQFGTEGAAGIPSYWDKSWESTSICSLVAWQTAFSLQVDSDYAYCVCSNQGIPEASCVV